MDSADGFGTGDAKGCEPVHYRGADLGLRNLTIEVTGRRALTKQFHTMHFRLNAVSTVVPS
jgi:hypothetical protein